MTEAAVKVAPEGKQNSFASRAYASYVLAEKGDQQPRSLSVAYLKPINHRENDDFIRDSIAALIDQKNSFDQVYGECGKAHIPFEQGESFCKDCGLDQYEMNVSKKHGTLSGLLDFVSK